MFERYTERARRVVFFARYEAAQLGSSTIEPLHLLLGAMREGGRAAAALGEFGITRESIVAQVPDPTERGSTGIDIPLTPPSMRVFSGAATEAQARGHHFIDVEHLLLALLEDEVIGSVLPPGCDVGELRARVAQSLRPPERGRGPAPTCLRCGVTLEPAALSTPFALHLPDRPLPAVHARVCPRCGHIELVVGSAG